MKKLTAIFLAAATLLTIFSFAGCSKSVRSEVFVQVGDSYEGSRDFSEGYAAVKKDGKWGFIDSEGNIAVEPKYAAVWSFSEGLAAVQTEDGKWGFIDTSGSEVIEPQFDAAWYFSGGLAAVREGKLFGYIDHSGNFVIEPKYTDATNFDNGCSERRGQVGFYR